MMKKAYEKPQATVVKMKPVTLICASQLDSVNVRRNIMMSEDEEFE